jgi:hypothetical protein
MKKHLMIIGALLAATPAEARVVTDDGNELLEVCTRDDYFSQGYCLGYIRALSDGVDMVLYTGNQKICYGDNVTIGQIRDVVIDYVKRNPAKRNKNAMVLVSWALAEAWPCQ